MPARAMWRCRWDGQGTAAGFPFDIRDGKGLHPEDDSGGGMKNIGSIPHLHSCLLCRLGLRIKVE